MWLVEPSDKRASDHATSDLLKPAQRLEREHEELRARLEGGRELRILAPNVGTA